MAQLQNGDFTQDLNSKYEFIQSVTTYVKENFNYTPTFYGINDDYQLVELGTESSTARLDLAMGYKGAYYAIELKERQEDYPSTRYGEEWQGGWIYNMEKDSALQTATQYGYIPLYVNLYPDHIINIWNINNISKMETIERDIKKNWVVENSPRIPQKRYTLFNKDAIRLTTDGKLISKPN